VIAVAFKSISHYQITGTLGQGGMGVVYKATDTTLNRTVAIKTLPPDRLADHKLRQRLMSEARAASALNHPNICTIYEVGEADGILFIAMEYVNGHALSDDIDRGPIDIDRALDIAIQVSKALTHAHRGNIVHRDIKPSNIAVTEEGSVKILDFGLARLIDQIDSRADTQHQPLTEEGQVVGTVAYMSPEQLNAEEIDARSDLFSLGVVLYEMIRGQRPFRGDTLAQVIRSTLADQPESLRTTNTSVPAELDRVIGRALAKNRDDRYATTKDLLQDLLTLKDSLNSPRRKLL
jgi:eukaryotic-like serine/threonine-protein kinase